jgi:hypothetical protein
MPINHLNHHHTAEESLMITKWRTYQWGELWNDVKDASQGSDLAFKVLLLSAWWQEFDLAREYLKRLPKLQQTNNPLLVFCITLTLACVGDKSAILMALEKLKRQHAPSWLVLWLEIEFFGRSRQFATQAKLVSKALGKFQEWACIAAIQSLNQKSISSEPLLAVLNNLPAEVAKRPLVLLLKDHLEQSSGNSNLAFKSVCTKYPDFAIAHYYYANAAVERGDMLTSLPTFDRLIAQGCANKLLLRKWLSASSSHPLVWDNLAHRVQHAAKLACPNARFLAELASIALVFYWAEGDLINAYSLVTLHQAYLDMEERDDDRAAQVFFRLILGFCIYWQRNQALYLPSVTDLRLEVVGESHCLTIANAQFEWCGHLVKGRSHFVMGVKMHHLARPVSSQQKSCIAAHLKNLPIGSHVMLTIGEIDCRPNEGIWVAAQKTQLPVSQLVRDTTNGYLKWLEQEVRDREFTSITIQGIAAPEYPLEGKRDPGDRTAFLEMIREVNEELKTGALSYGWRFLDIYGATVAEDGKSNGLWHLDGNHLKPGFYIQAAQWLITDNSPMQHKTTSITRG